MSGPKTVRRMRAPSRPRWLRAAPAALVVIAVVAVALGVCSGVTRLPGSVDRISFENPTVYDLDIEVTGRDRDGWVLLGTAQAGETTTVEDIPDQGDLWILRLGAQGKEAGELRLTREQLERVRWTVSVPRWIADELKAKGAPPSP